MSRPEDSRSEDSPSEGSTSPPADLPRHRGFLDLGPERVLDAVERGGLETRPVCYPLNSFENRVYEVELADRSRVVAKFYRPGRWSEAQILEEHAFLTELDEEEIPVCAVRPFPGGHSVETVDGIHYSLWDRKAGRAPDELSDEAVERLGMFVGRMHAVGARRPFSHRPRLDADRYVRRALAFLREHRLVPGAYERRYFAAAEEIAEVADREMPAFETQRLHADLHLGNVLFRDGVLRVLDFDDACTGPPVQDLWLALPGRDAETARQRHLFLTGYERFRAFDDTSLRLVEILRGLRLVRYCGWLARRYEDPAFRAGWPHFGTEDYWRRETEDLEEQIGTIRRELRAPRPGRGGQPESAASALGRADEETDAELTNADFFWDWEEN